jgi:hypothetical protein
MSEKKIQIPLRVGSRVTLYEDVDIDSGEGLAASVSFEDYVAQYVPETGLLEFENSDVGRAEFIQMTEDADGVEIVKDES